MSDKSKASGSSGSEEKKDVPMISRTGRVKSTAIRLWPGAPERPEDREFGKGDKKILCVFVG